MLFAVFEEHLKFVVDNEELVIVNFSHKVKVRTVAYLLPSVWRRTECILILGST